MEQSRKAKLQAIIQTGMVMRQFMNHPGFDIWNKDLDSLINDTRKEWLTAEDPVKAEKVRTRASQLNMALDLIKRRVIEGDNAAKLLNQLEVEESELNQAPQNG